METIVPEHAARGVAGEITAASSAAAIAAAEPGHARETPASAVILSFPAPRMAEKELPPPHPLLAHAPGSVPDYVRYVVGGVFRKATTLKNVPLAPDELDTATSAVLEGLTLAERYQLVAGHPAAVDAVARLVAHRLEDTAIARLILAVSAMEDKRADDPAVTAAVKTLLAMVEGRRDPANPTAWPDLTRLLDDYYRVTPSGPIVEELPVGTLTTYWLGGNYHRDPQDGPARHYTDGTRTWSEYWVNGVLHRLASEGPAFTYSHFEGQEIAGEEYIENGIRHRRSAEGPAIRHVDRTGTCTRAVFYRDGVRHRHPKDGPAWSGIENGEYIEEHVADGHLHRDEAEGPAIISRHLLTDAVTREEYYCHGQSHRLGGPAITYRDTLGLTVYEAWFRDGVMHRDPAKGPAVISSYGEDGERREVYVVDGCTHRDTVVGPAVIVFDATGQIIEQEYWRDNVLLTPPQPSGAEAQSDV